MKLCEYIVDEVNAEEFPVIRLHNLARKEVYDGRIADLPVEFYGWEFFFGDKVGGPEYDFVEVYADNLAEISNENLLKYLSDFGSDMSYVFRGYGKEAVSALRDEIFLRMGGDPKGCRRVR